MIAGLAFVAWLATRRIGWLRTWSDTVDPRVLVLPHLLRAVAAAGFLQAVSRGELPAGFALPAAWGDFAVAALAALLLSAGAIRTGITRARGRSGTSSASSTSCSWSPTRPGSGWRIPPRCRRCSGCRWRSCRRSSCRLCSSRTRCSSAACRPSRGPAHDEPSRLRARRAAGHSESRARGHRRGRGGDVPAVASCALRVGQRRALRASRPPTWCGRAGWGRCGSASGCLTRWTGRGSRRSSTSDAAAAFS